MIGAVFGSADRVHVTHRTRTVGALHLALAGVVNFATGVGLAYASVSGRLMRFLFYNLDHYVTTMTVLARAEDVVFVATDVALVAGLALTALGVAQVRYSRGAYRGRRWNRSLRWSTAGAVNPLALPLALIAVASLYASKARFDS